MTFIVWWRRRSGNAIMLISSSYHVSMLDNTQLGGLACPGLPSSYKLYLMVPVSLILINFPPLLESMEARQLSTYHSLGHRN